MAFVTPVVEHWLKREIAQWVHPMKDRSDDPSHHERTLLPQSYISLHNMTIAWLIKKKSIFFFCFQTSSSQKGWYSVQLVECSFEVLLCIYTYYSCLYPFKVQYVVLVTHFYYLVCLCRIVNKLVGFVSC